MGKGDFNNDGVIDTLLLLDDGTEFIFEDITPKQLIDLDIFAGVKLGNVLDLDLNI